MCLYHPIESSDKLRADIRTHNSIVFYLVGEIITTKKRANEKESQLLSVSNVHCNMFCLGTRDLSWQWICLG